MREKYLKTTHVNTLSDEDLKKVSTDLHLKTIHVNTL